MEAVQVKGIKGLNTKSDERNYELDFFKLIFAILVFYRHALLYSSEDSKLLFPNQLGEIAVHFFFVVSGLLMANSLTKKNITENCGKASINFVIHRFKSLVWVMWSSFIISFGIYIYIYIYTKYENTGWRGLAKYFAKVFPEMLGVYCSGVWVTEINGMTWYISAMLIAMLPLVYIFLKNKDLMLYVVSPLMALLTLGYMFQKENHCFMNHRAFWFFITGAIIRALCGISFGVCAFTICSKLKNAKPNKNFRLLLTVAEAVLYLIFFGTWFFCHDNDAIMSVVLILPIALAITFSGESYIANLFKYRWMKIFAPLSLYIYLNHGNGYDVATRLFERQSWGYTTIVMIIFTALSSELCWVMVRFGKVIWKKAIIPYFTKKD